MDEMYMTVPEALLELRDLNVLSDEQYETVKEMWYNRTILDGFPMCNESAADYIFSTIADGIENRSVFNDDPIAYMLTAGFRHLSQNWNTAPVNMLAETFQGMVNLVYTPKDVVQHRLDMMHNMERYGMF